MLVIQLITDALIKARVRKKRIIIVLIIIYSFYFFWLTNLLHRFFHEWQVTLIYFLFIGGIMFFEMKYLIKFIDTEKKNIHSE